MVERTKVMDAVRTMARTIATWEWLFLLGLLPLVIFLPGPWAVVLLAIPFFWIARKVAGGRFLPATPFNFALFLLLGMVGVSYAATFSLDVSLPKVTNLLLSIALFFAAAYFARNRDNGLWVILAITLLAGTGMAVVGLLGMQWDPPFQALNLVRESLPATLRGIPAANGGFIGANELAGTLCWVAPLSVACLIGLWRPLSTRRKPLLALLTTAAIINTFLLLATMSRGGIVGLVIGLALVVGLYVETRWRVALAVSLFVGSLVAFFTYSNPQIGPDVIGDAMGLRGRLEIWQRALQAIGDFPLTGMSVNGFREVVDVVYPLFTTAPDVDIAHAHNHLLQTALDVGLPGLVAYLALWLLTAAILVQTIRRMRADHQTARPYYAVSVGLAGSFAAGWMFGIADAIALGSRPAFMWWLLLALAASVHYDVVVRRMSGAARRRRGALQESRGAASLAGTETEQVKRPLPPPPLPHAPRAARRTPVPRPNGERPPLLRPPSDRPPSA